MFHILVVDDDKHTRMLLRAILQNENYTVSTAENGEEALKVLDNEHIDLVVLDVMMPKMDGYTFTKTIRETDSAMPILMVTAKTLPSDEKQGFLVGTDDYITKPFNPVEMLARVRSQIRRFTKLGGNISHTDNDVLTIGSISINDASKTVQIDGEIVALTPTEYEILKLLMKNKGRVMSQKEIYESVRNEMAFGAENTIAVHIRHLREKIEINPSEPRYIKVVWAHGYKFEG